MKLNEYGKYFLLESGFSKGAIKRFPFTQQGLTEGMDELHSHWEKGYANNLWLQIEYNGYSCGWISYNPHFSKKRRRFSYSPGYGAKPKKGFTIHTIERRLAERVRKGEFYDWDKS